jgi:hypothetical protein
VMSCKCYGRKLCVIYVHFLEETQNMLANPDSLKAHLRGRSFKWTALPEIRTETLETVDTSRPSRTGAQISYGAQYC